VGSAVAIGAVLAVFAAGCAEDAEPLPPLCGNGPEQVLAALERAPEPVALADGTRLSDCVAHARSDADLQLVGLTLTPAADELAGAKTEAAAERLGYLVGAMRRGAAAGNGVQVELVRRVEARVRYEDPALLAAAERGARAGETSG
jgi:hypothetical protein